MVRELNIDGDGQGDLAGHGGEQRAVFVYQMDSYQYWERFLGRADFGFGQFGKNFTVEGPADNEGCIGDRYRIGDAVFEVTQPRVTCYLVAPAVPSNARHEVSAARIPMNRRVTCACAFRIDP
jgi:MOSC domain-containing protein YiiM